MKVSPSPEALVELEVTILHEPLLQPLPDSIVRLLDKPKISIRCHMQAQQQVSIYIKYHVCCGKVQ